MSPETRFYRLSCPELEGRKDFSVTVRSFLFLFSVFSSKVVQSLNRLKTLISSTLTWPSILSLLRRCRVLHVVSFDIDSDLGKTPETQGSVVLISPSPFSSSLVLLLTFRTTTLSLRSVRRRGENINLLTVDLLLWTLLWFWYERSLSFLTGTPPGVDDQVHDRDRYPWVANRTERRGKENLEVQTKPLGE